MLREIRHSCCIYVLYCHHFHVQCKYTMLEKGQFIFTYTFGTCSKLSDFGRLPNQVNNKIKHCAYLTITLTLFSFATVRIFN